MGELVKLKVNEGEAFIVKSWTKDFYKDEFTGEAFKNFYFNSEICIETLEIYERYLKSDNVNRIELTIYKEGELMYSVVSEDAIINSYSENGATDFSYSNTNINFGFKYKSEKISFYKDSKLVKEIKN